MPRRTSVATSSETREAALAALKHVARAIVETFGPETTEVVIHDISDLERSIIWIEGNVTNRHVGGAMTDLGLSTIRSGKFEDLFNYRTYLPDGRTLKSSSVFLRDEDGHVWGTFCINQDVTPLLHLQRMLEPLIADRPGPEIRETFTDSIEDTLQRLVAESAGLIGRPVTEMDHAQRVELIKLLDQKGAFQVRGAVPILARSLSVSRYTIYNLRAEARGEGPARTPVPDATSQ